MTGPARWTLYPGRARLPDAASPDVRGRSHVVAADVWLAPGDGGVLLSHGDRHAGYAVRVEAGRLVHDYAHAGALTTTRSTEPVPVGRWTRVEVRVRRVGEAGTVRLVVDGRTVEMGLLPALARARTGYTGVDVGCDRGLTVGGYAAPARFTGRLVQVDVEAADDQWLDEAAVWEIEGSTG